MVLWALVCASPFAAAQAAKDVLTDMQVATWASSCMACHGTDGKAEGVGLTIGGQSADELHKDLLDYKSGKKQGTIMHQHARGYTDDELKRIALYFSQVKK
jgi:cytochrome c553